MTKNVKFMVFGTVGEVPGLCNHLAATGTPFFVDNGFVSLPDDTPETFAKFKAGFAEKARIMREKMGEDAVYVFLLNNDASVRLNEMSAGKSLNIRPAEERLGTLLELMPENSIVTTFSTETPMPYYEAMVKDYGLHIGGIVKLGYSAGEISGADVILAQKPPGLVVPLAADFTPLAYNHYTPGT